MPKPSFLSCAFDHAVVFGCNDNGYTLGSGTDEVQLWAKQGSVPANANDGTQLGTTGSFTDQADQADQSTGKTIASSNTTTAWDHVWAAIVKGGGSGVCVLGELQVWKP